MSNIMNRDEYELSNEYEVNDLISEIPVELTKSSIVNQINNPIFSSTDFFSSFRERCEFIIQRYDDEDPKIAARELLLDMSKSILDELDNAYHFDFDLEGIASDEHLMVTYADTCYRFFVLNYKRLVVKYVFRFIKSHRGELFKAYDSKLNKKDVGSINAKRLSKDKEYAVILSALPSIVKDILDMDCDILDFVDLVQDEDSFEGSVITEMVNNEIITGNPIPSYLNLASGEENDTFADVYGAVRTKIINKIEKTN